MTAASVEGQIDFDPSCLAPILVDAFGPDGGRFRIERIGGGQSNPTYRLDWNARRLVLRKKPNGPVRKGAHAIEREFRVLGALRDSDVPVPAPVLLHGDPDALGTPFYLMERVEGRVFEDPALSDLPMAQRKPVWLAAAETLARLHALDPGAIGLSDFGRPGNYFERQIALWDRQYRASPSRPIEPIERVHRWLAENLPPSRDPARLCHGDFRIGNLLYHPTEPRVVAVLDWELSTLGDPMADLGFICMAWHTSPDEYGGLLGLDFEKEGLPLETEFVSRYRAARGADVDLLPFHRIFSLYRFAVIFVGISDRVLAGTAADPGAAAYAPLAERFAIRALEICARASG